MESFKDQDDKDDKDDNPMSVTLKTLTNNYLYNLNSNYIYKFDPDESKYKGAYKSTEVKNGKILLDHNESTFFEIKENGNVILGTTNYKIRDLGSSIKFSQLDAYNDVISDFTLEKLNTEQEVVFRFLVGPSWKNELNQYFNFTVSNDFTSGSRNNQNQSKWENFTVSDLDLTLGSKVYRITHAKRNKIVMQEVINNKVQSDMLEYITK